MLIQTNWDHIKELKSTGWSMYHSISNSGSTNNYYVYLSNPPGNVSFSCLLKDSTPEFIEFVSVYKPSSNKAMDVTDGKVNTYASPRPPGTMTYYTSECDDITNPTLIGGGDLLHFIHTTDSTSTVEFFYADFNVIENRSYIFDADISWTNAAGDKITCTIVPEVTDSTASTSTNYNLYGGYLITPAAGDGTLYVDPSSMKLVESPVNKFGIRETAFWNADWNTTTKVFDNITAAPFGDGKYNMFAVEVSLLKFVNNIILNGSRSIRFYSKDINEIYTGMRFKFTTTTVGIDHAWSSCIMFMMFREKTI